MQKKGDLYGCGTRIGTIAVPLVFITGILSDSSTPWGLAIPAKDNKHNMCICKVPSAYVSILMYVIYIIYIKNI